MSEYTEGGREGGREIAAQEGGRRSPVGWVGSVPPTLHLGMDNTACDVTTTTTITTTIASTTKTATTVDDMT